MPIKKPRQRKQKVYKSLKLSKKIKQTEPIDGPIKLIKESFRIIFSNKKVFLGIVVVGGLVGLIIAKSFGSAVSLDDLKTSTQSVIGQNKNSTGVNLALLAQFVSSSGGSVGQVSGAYQTIFWIIISLASIWGIRQVLAGEKIHLKDTFYKGIFPLIPFILVLFVISLQSIPLLIGNFIFAVVYAGGLAVTVLEKLFVIAIVLLFSLLSIYMLLSSLFGLYIVTLPDMTPMKALRSARGLVLHRRIALFARLIFLLFVLGFILVGLLLPLMFLSPSLVIFAFYFVTTFIVVLANSYIYLLYRSML